jgi:hypothetical protein
MDLTQCSVYLTKDQSLILPQMLSILEAFNIAFMLDDNFQRYDLSYLINFATPFSLQIADHFQTAG